MMLYEYFFTRALENGGKLFVSVLLISDTGYFFSDHDQPDKARTLDYAPAEQSRTCIGFLATTNIEHWKGPAFVWNRAQMKTFIETGGDLPEEYGAAAICGKCYHFSRLSSEDETNRLIDELVSAFSGKGIPLKRLERKV